MIISQNVRGLKRESKLEELFDTMDSRGSYANCVQEHWRNDVEVLERNGMTAIMVGLSEVDQTKRGSQGVGIVLSARATKAWKACGSEKHVDLGARVVAVRFQRQ